MDDPFLAMGNGVSSELKGTSGYEACPSRPESPSPFQSERPPIPRRHSSHPYKSINKIACLGSGFVGGPTSAVIAFKTGLEVTVVDIDKERIDAWNSDHLPIFEPHLKGIVKAARDGNVPLHSDVKLDGPAGGYFTPKATPSKATGNTLEKRSPNLFFSTDVEAAIAGADLIFVCVNTPTKTVGIGKGAAADIGYIEVATRAIAKVATHHKIIVEKSTVPCKTAEAIRKILEANARPGVHFDVLSNPEFLAEGTAIRDLLWPDRVIIGSASTSSGRKSAAALEEVYAHWIPKDRIVTMNLWSSELSKLAANAMLAQRVSSVNALSAICEATGADVEEVARAVGLDSRIGSNMLRAGPGFGGSCFQKDIFNIVYLAESLHLQEVADYWRAIIKMNEYQKLRFTKRILACLFNSLTNKKIAVLGFAFKKDTSDTRESPAIALIKNLITEGGRVAIYDPCVKEKQIWGELLADGHEVGPLKRNVEVFTNVYDACDEADAVVVATEWDEFSNRESQTQLARLTLADVSIGQMVGAASQSVLCEAKTPSARTSVSELHTDSTDSTALPPTPPKSIKTSEVPTPKTGNRLDWSWIAKRMKKPRFVFDARNVLDAEELREMGFIVESIGKAPSDFHLRRDF